MVLPLLCDLCGDTAMIDKLRKLVAFAKLASENAGPGVTTTVVVAVVVAGVVTCELVRSFVL